MGDLTFCTRAHTGALIIIFRTRASRSTTTRASTALGACCLGGSAARAGAASKTRTATPSGASSAKCSATCAGCVLFAPPFELERKLRCVAVLIFASVCRFMYFAPALPSVPVLRDRRGAPPRGHRAHRRRRHLLVGAAAQFTRVASQGDLRH